MMDDPLPKMVIDDHYLFDQEDPLSLPPLHTHSHELTVFLLLTSPRQMMALISGAHDSNSLCQAGIVDRGTTTRNGPQSWCSWQSQWRKEMVWIVLPRPISSARITELPLKKLKEKQQIVLLQIRGEVTPHKLFTTLASLIPMPYSKPFNAAY